MDISQLFNSQVAAFSWQAVVIYLGTMVLYFLAEFKTRSSNSTFSLGYWIKDNWINLTASAVLFIIYNAANEAVQSGVLIMFALATNYALDIVQSLQTRK